MILTILIFDSLDSFREGTCSLFLNSLSAILFTWRCLLVVLSFFLPEASARVFLAVGATALCVETLSFQITSADLQPQQGQQLEPQLEHPNRLETTCVPKP